jgi:hypothetical protein
VAAALAARFGMAGVLLAMLVLHGIDYLLKEKSNGTFRHPGVALGAAGGRAPGA